MGRIKKDYIALNIKADAEVMRRFIEYCEEMGQSKTTAFERIVTEHLDRRDAEKKHQKKAEK